MFVYLVVECTEVELNAGHLYIFTCLVVISNVLACHGQILDFIGEVLVMVEAYLELDINITV